jgi:hypothetical protein
MSDIVWVAENDWSKVNIGQKVRVTRDGGMLTGEIMDGGRECLWIIDDGILEAAFVRPNVWSLFVEAPPAVVLPSEDGLYESSTGGVWRAFEGVLVSLTNPSMCLEPAKFAPYTRLEPVPETAKKVLDRIKAESISTVTPMRHDLSIGLSALKMVATEFGVTA